MQTGVFTEGGAKFVLADPENPEGARRLDKLRLPRRLVFAELGLE